MCLTWSEIKPLPESVEHYGEEIKYLKIYHAGNEEFSVKGKVNIIIYT